MTEVVCLRNKSTVHLIGGKRLSFSFSFVVSMTLVSMFLISSTVSAGPSPKVVRGWIWDVDGRPVEGASVTINIRYASNGTIRSTLTDTTLSDGFYSKTFGISDWDISDTIEVIATKGGQQSNSTTADNKPIQYVNVTFPYAIPEFGGMLGYLAAGGAVGAVGIALVAYKRKK